MIVVPHFTANPSLPVDNVFVFLCCAFRVLILDSVHGCGRLGRLGHSSAASFHIFAHSAVKIARSLCSIMRRGILSCGTREHLFFWAICDAFLFTGL